MTTINSYSTTNRITGMVSGLDVDSIVESLMEAEEVPLEKLEQKKELVEWKRDAYREVSNLLRAFADKYLNYSSSSFNMLSQSTYQQYSSTSTAESIVTVTPDSKATTGSHTVVVSNLATAASCQSSAGVTAAITAFSTADFDAAVGSSLVLEIDGTEYTVALDESITGIDDLQKAIDEAVGSGKIVVSDTNGDGTGYLTIAKAEESGIGTITLSNGDEGDALSALGFSSIDDLSNYLDTADTLETIAERLGFDFDSGGNVNLTINGVSFEFSKSTTLESMMDEINTSAAGVTMKYRTNSDSFSLTANNTGAGNTLRISESGSTFIQDIGITGYTSGEDAVVTIDGEKYTRSSNSLTLDGVTYSLKAESTETQTVSISQDTDAVYTKITSFIEAYNDLIDSINNTISEEYDRDYQPLTDDQKAEMSDDEIEAWEEKAKTGLLEDDTTLTNLLRNMRTALYESVSGVSVNLTEIGISTSSNYQDKGKLVIDEDALREAIESNPAGVMNLFSQQSTTYSGTASVVNLSSAQREIRTGEEGLAYRIYDILQDNISTNTGIGNTKGILIEKAGLEDDSSEYDNLLTSQINNYSEKIEAMLKKLEEKENNYYEKYSLMETYINQMNNQLNTLLSYLE
ncbi:MAG TPA: flagellar filament capping protein FliD [Desulfitobacteriaceae bacterium]|nr:flagellar filament capping protein FliD [Desulfitobacteriaceae bacterium]